MPVLAGFGRSWPELEFDGGRFWSVYQSVDNREPPGHPSRLTVMSDQLVYTLSGTVLLFAAVVLMATLQLI